MVRIERATAIVVPCSAPNGYGTVVSLSEAGVGVLALDHGDVPARHSRFARFEQVEDPDRNADGFLEQILALAARMAEPPVLFPTQDFHATVFQQARARLAGRVRFPFLPPGAFLACVDKRRMLARARAAGLDVPESYWPPDSEALRRILPRLRRFPYLLKPIAKFQWRDGRPTGNFSFHSRFGAKALPVRSPRELVRVFDETSRLGFSVIVQEEIEGPVDRLVAIDFQAGEGGALGLYHTGRKLRQLPYDYGTCTFGRSEPVPEIVEPCRRLIASLRFRGIGNIEFKERGGRHYFIELNPRPWMWIRMAAVAGRNLPLAAYRDLRGESPPVPSAGRPRVAWLDLRHDLEHLRLPATGSPVPQVGFLEWIRSLRSVRVEARTDVRDPIPALFTAAAAAARRLRHAETAEAAR